MQMQKELENLVKNEIFKINYFNEKDEIKMLSCKVKSIPEDIEKNLNNNTLAVHDININDWFIIPVEKIITINDELFTMEY